ncbi:MAG: DUF6709 family protein [Gemmatimonadota bacterium]
METWITTRIRTTARRRFVTWVLVLIAGAWLATSDHRYVANFLRGPYQLQQADLDAINDVTLTPRYYARVKGERVIDTGLREYTVHTRSGVETDRAESGAYRALVFGNRFLIVKTKTSTESPAAEGKLVPWPAELDGQLFDTKEMLALRSNFYPFYLDGDSFRRPGYVVIAIGVVFLLLFAWKAIPAWRAMRDPEHDPLAMRIARWGDPVAVAVEAEREWENPLLKAKAGWRFGNKYLLHSRFFTFDLLRFQDVLWAYKKVTKHSVNFIPTGKTYEAIVNCYGGTATIPAKEKKVHELLEFVQQQAPWAILGFSDELAATFRKHPQDFTKGVEQRRQEWQRQKASA